MPARRGRRGPAFTRYVPSLTTACWAPGNIGDPTTTRQCRLKHGSRPHPSRQGLRPAASHGIPVGPEGHDPHRFRWRHSRLLGLAHRQGTEFLMLRQVSIHGAVADVLPLVPRKGGAKRTTVTDLNETVRGLPTSPACRI